MATIRLQDKTHKALKEISRVTGKSLQAALEGAVEQERRRIYLEGLSADYAELRKDPKAWNEFRKELKEWDATLKDGLEND